MSRLTDRLRPSDPALRYEPVTLAVNLQPRLMVVVDTEEEFDWSAPFSRAATSVHATRRLERVQAIFDRYGIRPTYLIDYPVASQTEGVEPLRAIIDTGRCAIGAHLHPWVTPPFEEPISRPNSYPCNLGKRLEEAKLRVLTSAIESAFGRTVRVYKAGRYGIGANTIPILERLGYEVDASINPHMDFTADGGPSFDTFDARPFYFGTTRRLLEVPATGGFTGVAGTLAPAFHRLASVNSLSPFRPIGLLARLRVASKVMLSPEGFELSELKGLTRTLLSRGQRSFVLSFHSPSVEVGHTPYVRNRHDLDQFLGRIDAYCEFFFKVLGGAAATLEEFKASLTPSALPALAPVPVN